MITKSKHALIKRPPHNKPPQGREPEYSHAASDASAPPYSEFSNPQVFPCKLEDLQPSSCWPRTLASEPPLCPTSQCEGNILILPSHRVSGLGQDEGLCLCYRLSDRGKILCCAD